MMNDMVEQLEQQHLVIEGLRGHIAALDHALRLLIACSPNQVVFQATWVAMVTELEDDSTPRTKSGDIYQLALKQCADRIMSQYHEAVWGDSKIEYAS